MAEKAGPPAPKAEEKIAKLIPLPPTAEEKPIKKAEPKKDPNSFKPKILDPKPEKLAALPKAKPTPAAAPKPQALPEKLLAMTPTKTNPKPIVLSLKNPPEKQPPSAIKPAAGTPEKAKDAALKQPPIPPAQEKTAKPSILAPVPLFAATEDEPEQKQETPAPAPAAPALAPPAQVVEKPQQAPILEAKATPAQTAFKPVPEKREVAPQDPPKPKTPAGPDLKKIQIWEGKEGDWLKKTLVLWCKQSGVTLNWDTKKRPELDIDLYVSGTFENALKTLFSAGIHDGPAYRFSAETRELHVTDPAP